MNTLESMQKSSVLEKGTKFLDESLELVDVLRTTMYKIDQIINDEESLRKFAFEYNWLENLRRNAQEHGKRDPHGTLKAVESVIPSVTSLVYRDPDFSRFIAAERNKLSGEFQILNYLSSVNQNPAGLNANMEWVIEQMNQVKDEELKDRLLRRLEILRKKFKEISSLNTIINDLNHWGLYFHDDFTFFTDRIEYYFVGDKDRIVKFVGLNQFNEQSLKQVIDNSREIKILLTLAGFTYKKDAQSKFISDLLSLLQGDTREGEWISTKNTRVFLDNLDKYANHFEISFKNKYFASTLKKNVKLQELTLAWIKILSQMKKALDIVIPKKTYVLENAKNFLLKIFTKRKQELEKSVATLTYQISKVAEEVLFPKDFHKQLNRILSRIEGTIKKQWIERKRTFQEMKSKTDRSLNDIGPKIQDFSDKTDTSKDWDRYMAKIGEFVNYWESTTKLPENMSSDADAFSHLVNLDIDVASMIGLHPDILSIEQVIFRKRDYFIKNVGILKSLITQVMNLIIELTSWVDSTRIEIPNFSTIVVKKRLDDFRGEYYGR